MVNTVNNFFVKADNLCDYIPTVSTLSNLIDLFQKYVILPFISNQTIDNSHYYTHLKNKSILRSIVLLIPVIGNVIVGIYDFGLNNRKIMLAAVKKNGLALQYASKRLKSDKEIVLAAVQQDGFAIYYANEGLKNNKSVVLAAVKQNGLALQHACKDISSNIEIVFAAFQQNSLALAYASEELQQKLRTPA
jgi:hypothetical protein